MPIGFTDALSALTKIDGTASLSGEGSKIPPKHSDQEVAHRHASGQITKHTPDDR